MADGGQPNTFGFSGYTRGRGESCWFEVPQTFSELYEDYTFCGFRHKKRKYGVWKLEDVKILDESEWPKDDDMDLLIENTIWGTYGKDGGEDLHYIHLKDADTDHLNNILTQGLPSDELKNIIGTILVRRNQLKYP